MTRNIPKFSYKYVFARFSCSGILAIIATAHRTPGADSVDGRHQGHRYRFLRRCGSERDRTATDNETGAVRTVTTGGDGSFIVTVLPLGTYRLHVQAAGFKPLEVPSIVVNVTETAAFNPVLEVGGQTQEVTVQATAEAVQTTNATMGTVVSSKTATAIPLTTRNYTNLLGLSAGANTSVFNATSLEKAPRTLP